MMRARVSLTGVVGHLDGDLVRVRVRVRVRIRGQG